MTAPSEKILKVFFRYLKAHIEALATVEPRGEDLREWYSHVHNVCGTAGTIGFEDIYQMLLPWEQRLYEAVNNGHPLSPEEEEELKNTWGMLNRHLAAGEGVPAKNGDNGSDMPNQVLLIDDEETIYLEVKDALKEVGIDVIWANTAEEGLYLLENTRIDLVILDVMLPDMSGYQLFERIKEDHRFELIPVVFLTVKSSVSERIEGWDLGADDYITKPFDRQELTARIKNRLQKAGAMMRHSAYDYLTKAHSREFFEEALSRTLAHAVRYHERFTLSIIDLDDFKKVNDTYGHLAGDEVLKVLVSFIRSHLRQDDILARYGGEEFVLLLINSTADDAVNKLNSLIKGFSQTVFMVPGQETSFSGVTFSAGVAVYPLNGTTPQELILAADKALYRAKTSGKARAVAADALPADAANGNIRILAVDDNKATLVYLKENLSMFGYKVETFTSPLQALKVAGFTRWDIALVDINMPEMDGYTFIRQLKEIQGNRAPDFMVLTVNNRMQDLVKAYELGISYYVLKPVNIWDLINRITAVTCRKNRANETKA